MKITISISFILILLSTSLNFSCKNEKKAKITSNKNDVKLLDSLSIELEKIKEESVIPGFTVNIVQEDDLLYSKGFGYSDIANKNKFSPQTIHTLASVSKTFIGVSIMKLVEEGKLNLDDPINNFLPFEVWNPYFPETVITIRHLVTHTSSLNDDFDDGEKRPSQLVEQSKYNKDEIPESLVEDIYYYDGTNMTLEDNVRQIFTPIGKWYSKSNFSNFKPGEKYEYSNEGATLAALIIEQVTGMSFSKFTQKYIFEPLEMRNTTWFYEELDSTISKLYIQYENHNPSKVFEFPRFNETGYPCGDLKSNGEDLSNYLIEMMRGFNGKGKLLNSKSYQILLNQQLNRNKFEEHNSNALNDEYNVGIFWAISEPGLRLHKGGSIGVYSILYFNPTNNIGVISYCNLAHPDFGKIVNTIREFEKKLRKKPAANRVARNKY